MFYLNVTRREELRLVTILAIELKTPKDFSALNIVI